MENESRQMTQQTEPTAQVGHSKMKKGKKALIVVIVCVLVLAVGGVCAYAFAGDYIKNAFAQLTMDDIEYYKWIKKKQADETIDKMADYIINAVPGLNDQTRVKNEISLVLEDTFTDMLNLMPMKKMGLMTEITREGDKLGTTVDASYNEVSLIDIDSILRAEKGKLYLRIKPYDSTPMDVSYVMDKELNDGKTIGEAVKELNEAAGREPVKVITGDIFKDCLRKYIYMAIDSVDEAVLEKNIKGKVGENEVEYDSLKISFKAGEALNVIKAVLKEAEKDDILLSELSKAGIEEETAVKLINEILKGAEEIDLEENNCKFTVESRLDNKGKQLGVEYSVKIDSTVYRLDCLNYEKDENHDNDVTISVGGTDIVNVTGRGRCLDDIYNGTVTIEPGKMVTAFLGGEAKLKADITNWSVNRTKIVSGECEISVKCDDAVAEQLGIEDINDYKAVYSVDGEKNNYNSRMKLSKDKTALLILEIKSLRDEEGILPIKSSEEMRVIGSDDDLKDYIDLSKLIGSILDTREEINDQTFDAMLEGIIEKITGTTVSIETVQSLYNTGLLDIFINNSMDAPDENNDIEFVPGTDGSGAMGITDVPASITDNSEAAEDNTAESVVENSESAGGSTPVSDWDMNESAIEPTPTPIIESDETAEGEVSEVENISYSDEPDYSLTGCSGDYLGISDEVCFTHYGEDYVKYYTFSDYTGLTYKKPEAEISDEAYEAAKQKFLADKNNVFTRPVTDRGVQMGDLVEMDIALILFGSPVEDYSFKNETADIGKYQYGEGLDDELIGMQCGESKQIKVTLNENYGAFAGFTGDFKITIKSINEYIPSEWTKDFVVGSAGYASLEQAEREIRETQSLSEDELEITNLLLNSLFETALRGNIPADVKAVEYDRLYKQNDRYFRTTSGMGVKEYYEENEGTVDFDTYFNGCTDEYMMKCALYNMIASEQKIYVTGEEYKTFVAELISQGGYKNYEELVSQCYEQQIVDMIIEQKVGKYIYVNAAAE